MFTLESILETPDLSSEADKILHQYAEPLVEGLLKSTKVQIGSAGEAGEGSMSTNPKARSAALRCLSAVPPIIRFEVLSKMKAPVLRELGLVLDDPVREVRREGVECRAVWYGYK